ncbi:ABC-type protease/lipase transport system fused ATPase/permease subunit [Azospirillum agricola]|uniref:hypothetical protein n=1 Tax=Azospirillum agricola TaxID=1720247 RepID=UPI001AE7093F|nr:hypothetical protein [Azospirillum agricola]MBP2230592.1 ABC-type protease/lipase transport system fused ATPase/permease subunit [Azospirillum agricola]
MAPQLPPKATPSPPFLAGAGAVGVLANGLVLCAPLYAAPMYDWLREDRSSAGPLVLAAAALGLFGVHTLLNAMHARRDAAWRFDALWIPPYLLALAFLHPILGAMAVAGVAALAALIAADELSAPSPWSAGGRESRPWTADPFGPADAFHTGLRFCGVVYQALILGAGAALVLHDTLAPGPFAGAALIAVATMRTAVRVTAAWRTRPAAGTV